MTVLTRRTLPEIPAPVTTPLATPVRAARSARPPLAAVPSRVGLPLAESRPSDIVDHWGEQSFPASDPPSNW